MQLTPGSRLGSYESRHWVGAGGMGEVYFARDTKLPRYVALKLLLPELTADEDRLRRFEQEARATSALNHPNILTIFEIGQEGPVHFIVTEFVDGVTLRRHMGEEDLTLGRTLEIVIQIAAALSAAHASGIVHRDIKPENIMLRSDGYVKVLDFGLAKLVPTHDQRPVDPNVSTAFNINTDPGAIVGTVNYMSPEQLRGMKVDGRADIWSLGVVIYEMIAGRPPFSGLTKSDVIAAILREEPLLLTRYSKDVPPDLQRIVAKSLRKEREDRYQIAKDLLIDLKDLKQDLELDAKQGRIRMSDPIDAPTDQTEVMPTENGVQQKGAQTNKVEPARPTSGAEYLFSEIKQHRTGATIVLTVLILCVAIVVAWFSMPLPRTTTAPNAAALSIKEIKTTSNVREGAISPDGKYIATVIEDAGKQSIKIQQSEFPSESLTIADGGEYRGLVFSRDGYSVYYLAKDEKESSLYQVTVFGGPARKLVSGLNTPITLSPDGTRLAFVRRKTGGTATVLITSRADGNDERELASAPAQFEFGTLLINTGPAWSPDGKVIACPIMSKGDRTHMEVVAAQVDDGSVQPIGSRQWFLIGQLGWLSDGSGLIMAAQEKPPPQAISQIWLVNYPGGDAKTLTAEGDYYQGISLTADSATLITTRPTQTSKIWVVSALEPNHAEELPASKDKGLGGLVWTPEGSIVYTSNESGTMKIWTMEVNGNNAKQLIYDKNGTEPAVAQRDSRFMVFASYETGTPHIWRKDMRGNDLKQLTSGSYEDWPDLSPDGQWVIYQGGDSSPDSVWKIPIDDGPSTLLSDKAARHPIFSPDGKLIACFLRDMESPWQLAVLPLAGGRPLKTFSIPPSVAGQWVGPRWTADGKAITYIVTKGGVSNIWMQPLAGEPARQLTNFNEDQIFAFAGSPDGKKLALVRGVNAKSIILMKNFRRD
jgi:serine/threonine protein kinase